MLNLQSPPEARLGTPDRQTCHGSALVQVVKNPPAMQETWVQSLGWKDPLEKGMASHSRSLAWRIPWTEEPGGLQFTGSQSQTQLNQLSTHVLLNFLSSFYFFLPLSFSFFMHCWFLTRLHETSTIHQHGDCKTEDLASRNLRMMQKVA